MKDSEVIRHLNVKLVKTWGDAGSGRMGLTVLKGERYYFGGVVSAWKPQARLTRI